MSVNGKFKLVDPDEMLATVELTMKVGEWRKVMDQLPSSWPANDIRYPIRDLIRKAEKHFFFLGEGEE